MSEVPVNANESKEEFEELDPHEMIAMKFVDIIYDIRQLQKKRKRDTRIISTITNHMAEMMRGSDDLSFLQGIVETAVNVLADKEKNSVKADKFTPADAKPQDVPPIEIETIEPAEFIEAAGEPAPPERHTCQNSTFDTMEPCRACESTVMVVSESSFRRSERELGYEVK